MERIPGISWCRHCDTPVRRWCASAGHVIEWSRGPVTLTALRAAIEELAEELAAGYSPRGKEPAPWVAQMLRELL